MDIRIGYGYDAHRLIKERRLVLCGCEIPFELGLDGHSDADAATHAVMDALLGALALGDIGKLFPDTDPAYCGADSMELLREVWRRISGQGWKLGNLDITIAAQRPRLQGYIPTMRAHLSTALEVSLEQVSVKATTEEHMGFTGSQEGMWTTAVCLLRRD